MKSGIRDHPIAASAIGTLMGDLGGRPGGRRANSAGRQAAAAAGHRRCVAVILVWSALVGRFSGDGNG